MSKKIRKGDEKYIMETGFKRGLKMGMYNYSGMGNNRK